LPGRARILRLGAMPESEGAGFWRNWPALTAAAAALLTAIGTLIGGLAAAGIIGGEGGDERTPTTLETTLATTSLPFEATADEERLGRMIPETIRSDCARAQPLAVRTLASISCRPPDAGGLAYHLFESPTGLNAYMRDRLDFGDDGSKCGEAASGSSSYRVGNETVGRLVCYLDGGKAWIEWSNVKAIVYAYAYRDDADWQALFNFWGGAGPSP
jgi:hypothetical protein